MSHVDIRFTDKNSERFMLARRVYKVIEDLENEYLYPDSETLGGFKFRDGQYKFSQIDEGEWTDFDSENDYWGYKEDYAWFRHSFTVPERFAGRPVVYQLTPSASGPWNRSNPQFIMYFNGELRQGGDSNHSEIRLLDCAKGGEEFDCCLNAYSDAWEFKGKLRMGARLKVVDDLGNVGVGGGEVGKAQAPRTPVATHLADDQLGLLAASRRGQRAVYLLHRVDGLVIHFLQRGLGVAHYDGGADQEEGKDQSLHILTCC